MLLLYNVVKENSLLFEIILENIELERKNIIYIWEQWVYHRANYLISKC